MGTIKITQVRSAIRRSYKQKRTLEALGLRKLHNTIEVKDNPAVLGMIEKVKHLLKVEK